MLEPKSWAQRNNAIFMLVAINLIVFVLVAFIKLFYLLRSPDADVVNSLYNNEILSLFVLPSSWDLYIQKPWTIFTNMFTHVGIWHVAGSMLWLWFFGYVVQDLTGNKKLFPLYIYGSLVAAIVFLTLFTFIPSLRVYGPDVLFGATAGTMAFMGASLRLAPGFKLFHFIPGGIPLWVVAIFYVVMDVASLSANRPVHIIAHLAAAAIGYLFIYLHQKGFDAGAWMNRLYDSATHLFKNRKREEISTPVFYYNATVEPFTKSSKVTEKRINEILDKILDQGMDSLTEEEKSLLKRSGQEDSV